MTNYQYPKAVKTALRYMTEMLGMTDDLAMLTEDHEWNTNYLVELAQLRKCLVRVNKAAESEGSGDYRKTMEEQAPVEELIAEIKVAETMEDLKVVEAKTDAADLTTEQIDTVVEAIVERREETHEAVVVGAGVAYVRRDYEPDADYIANLPELTCDNYQEVLRQAVDNATTEGHYDAVEELIEDAWGLNCGLELNTNLGVFEDALKALRAGETPAPTPAPAPEVAVEKEEDDVEFADPQTDDEEPDMAIFDNYSWWSDEDHNGKPADIFRFALQIDPNTCTLKEYLHGLLYARLDRGNGKEGALKIDELIELCSLRTFAGITWPVNGKGTTIKSKARKIITPVIADLKSETDYSKSGLKELTKHGYPTHSYYREEYLEECIFTFDTPADALEGDDLDEMVANIDVESLTLKVAQPDPNAKADVEEDEAPADAEEQLREVVSDAAARALALLNDD